MLLRGGGSGGGPRGCGRYFFVDGELVTARWAIFLAISACSWANSRDVDGYVMIIMSRSCVPLIKVARPAPKTPCTPHG